MNTFKQELLRKLIHLSSFWMLILIDYLDKTYALIVIGLMSLIIIAIDLLRRKNEFFKNLFLNIFGRMLRKSEVSKQPMGAVYFMIGVFTTMLFFSKQIAISALSVMIISDSFAALVGKKFGKYQVTADKTIEGMLAFFFSALIILIYFKNIWVVNSPSYLVVLIAAFFSTLAELYSKKINIDDNISIPLSVGLVLQLLT